MSLFGVILVRIWENTDQNNSEYGHFSRSHCHDGINCVFLNPLLTNIDLLKREVLKHLQNEKFKIKHVLTEVILVLICYSADGIVMV